MIKLEHNFTFRNTSQKTHNYIVFENSYFSIFLDITTLEMEARQSSLQYKITMKGDLVVQFWKCALKDSIHDPYEINGVYKYMDSSLVKPTL